MSQLCWEFRMELSPWHWNPGAEPRAGLMLERCPGCQGLEGSGRATESPAGARRP